MNHLTIGIWNVEGNVLIVFAAFNRPATFTADEFFATVAEFQRVHFPNAQIFVRQDAPTTVEL